MSGILGISIRSNPSLPITTHQSPPITPVITHHPSGPIHDPSITTHHLSLPINHHPSLPIIC